MNRQALQMNTDNYKAGEQTGEADGQKALQTHSQGRYTVKACGQTGNGQGRWTEGTVDTQSRQIHSQGMWTDRQWPRQMDRRHCRHTVKADTQSRHVDRQAMAKADGQKAL